MRGDYGAVPSQMKRINTTTDQLAETFPFDVNGVAAMNDKFLVFDYTSISLFDPALELIENSNFVDLANVTTLYNVTYRASNNQIYVSDAMNYSNTGYIRGFTSIGTYSSSYHVGLNPSKILFYD